MTIAAPRTWRSTAPRFHGATEASVDDLVKAGTIKLEKVTTIDLPRKKEWLGW